MDVLTLISKMLKDIGMTQKELCIRLGVNQQAFTNWKSGNNDSYIKKLPQIAEILGVSVDYLLGHDTAKPKKGPASGEVGLSDEIISFLDDFERLPPSVQESLIAAARTYLESEAETYPEGKKGKT